MYAAERRIYEAFFSDFIGCLPDSDRYNDGRGAQWSSADNAKTQYDALVAAQTGDESASGNVKVSGNVTGAYVVKADASNSKNAVAIWQNDTVVFQATGTKEAVDRFYQKFPM